MLDITAYTDGAVKGNGGPGRIGMGVLLIGPRTVELSKFLDEDPATNNRAELNAILMALEGIKEAVRGRTRMKIYSDSEWCIRSITGVYKCVTKNLDLIDQIKTLIAQYGSVEFVHVRGHAGEPNNERVNELAQRQAGTWKGK